MGYFNVLAMQSRYLLLLLLLLSLGFYLQSATQVPCRGFRLACECSENINIRKG